MGLEKRSTTFRFSDETLRELGALQIVFAPFAEDRSSTLRIVIALVYALIFTPSTIRDLFHVLQHLQRSTSQYSQLDIQFPPAIGDVRLRPCEDDPAWSPKKELNANV
jgi:hypothetical protein